MAKRIEKLSLCNFRGATCPVEVEFDTNKPVVMIFGENGTGKSTLVDAIDFVCNQEYGSLNERSSTFPKSHLPSLGSQAKDIEVSLSYGSQTWSGHLGTQGPRTTGPDGCPVARILRRSQILRLVNEQPKKRYEVLRSFLTVPNIEKSEQTLRDTVKTVGQDLDEAVRATQQAREALERFWQDEGRPSTDYLGWAGNKAKEDPTELKTFVGAVTDILEALRAVDNARDALDKAHKEQRALERKREEADEALTQGQKGESERKSSLITLLQDVQTFLQGNPTVTNCPVCEQDVDEKSLRDRITKRLSDMTSLVALKEAAGDAKSKAAGAAAVVLQAHKRFIVEVRKLAGLVKASIIPELAEPTIQCTKYPELLDDSESIETEALQQAQEFLAVVKDFQGALINRRDSDQKTLNQLSAIKGYIETFREKAKAAVYLNRVSKKLGAVLQIVEKQRKTYVENILTSISGMIEGLYQKIHPNESIGKTRFFLKPNVTGSLEFEGQFQTSSEVQPQAYYSESHLDTLGVCVFLALAEHFNNENTVIVLDDVLTSVDDVHLERFIQMLHDEAPNFNQLIITTHYRSWRDRYRFARGPSGNVQLIELLHWSLPRGIQHTGTKLSIDELCDWVKSDPLERQVVASKAGVLLESLLDHIALRYRCKLPRQAEPNYTLGDLLSSIDSKLSKALRVEKFGSSDIAGTQILLQPLINEIAEMGWVRNQVGCHFSIPGMGIADAEVILLAERTIKLAEALACSACGELPWRNKSGSFWECRCGQARLHPLTIPGGLPPAETEV